MTYLHLFGDVLANRAVMVIEIEQEISRSADLQRAKLNLLQLFDIFDRNSLAFGDDILAKWQRTFVESGLHLIHYFIYSALAQYCNEQPCEETGQPTSGPWFRDVAMSAMFPLPYLCGDEKAI